MNSRCGRHIGAIRAVQAAAGMRIPRAAGRAGDPDGPRATVWELVVAGRRSAGGKLARLDHTTMAKLGMLPTPPAAVRTARLLSGLAEPRVVSPVLGVAALLAARRGDWRAACLPVLAVGSGASLRRSLSEAVARARPPAGRWLTEPEGFSLPSKHTTLAVLTAGACVRSTSSRGPARHTAPLLAAAVIGASRVYLGVHWPTDVLAGWLFAESWLCLTARPVSNRHRRG